MLDQLTVADFVDHVNGKFPVSLNSGDVLDLVLIEAKAIGENRQPASGGRSQAFSLMFRGPLEPKLPQQIYPIEHPTRGMLEIFLVPVGPEGDPNGEHYQAIFN